MIVVVFKGGLGNQLFQYAAGLALAARHSEALCFDTRWYDEPAHQRAAVRTFDLPGFSVRGTLATAADLEPYGLEYGKPFLHRIAARIRRVRSRRKIWRDNRVGFAPEFATLPSGVMLDGYFQDPRYFAGMENELRSDLQPRKMPPPPVLAKAAGLASVPSVCIQIRRTDFVTNAETARTHGTCSREYYRSAWSQVRAQVPAARGFVFTDDFEWAQEAFRDWADVEVVDHSWNGPAYLHRFFLMQACRHFIIANSTWGWWAAWLGARADSVVVMPARWFANDEANGAISGLRMPGWHSY